MFISALVSSQNPQESQERKNVNHSESSYLNLNYTLAAASATLGTIAILASRYFPLLGGKESTSQLEGCNILVDSNSSNLIANWKEHPCINQTSTRHFNALASVITSLIPEQQQAVIEHAIQKSNRALFEAALNYLPLQVNTPLAKVLKNAADQAIFDGEFSLWNLAISRLALDELKFPTWISQLSSKKNNSTPALFCKSLAFQNFFKKWFSEHLETSKTNEEDPYDQILQELQEDAKNKGFISQATQLCKSNPICSLPKARELRENTSYCFLLGK